MEQNGWDVVWEEGSTSEWIVEYVVEHASERSRHLSLLLAEDADGVREALIEEIRSSTPTQDIWKSPWCGSSRSKTWATWSTPATLCPDQASSLRPSVDGTTSSRHVHPSARLCGPVHAHRGHEHQHVGQMSHGAILAEFLDLNLVGDKQQDDRDATAAEQQQHLQHPRTARSVGFLLHHHGRIQQGRKDAHADEAPGSPMTGAYP